MRVKTTKLRYEFMLRCVADDERLTNELTVEVDDSGVRKQSRVYIRTSYMAWVLILQAMHGRVFSVRGTAHRDVGIYARGAIQDIVTAMNAYTTHAAFTKTAVMGSQATDFPCWIVDFGNGEIYSPAPVPGGRFSMLNPVWHGYGQQKYTTWTPGFSLNREDRLAHEFTHQSLLESL